MATVTINLNTEDRADLAALEDFVRALRGPQVSGNPMQRTRVLPPLEPSIPPTPHVACSTADAELSMSAPATETVFSAPQVNVGPAPALDATEPVEVDSEGYPWDERIHSGAKSKTNAGTWTRRRNVPDEIYHQVRDELKGHGTMTAPTPPLPVAAPVVPPPPTVQVPAAPQPDPGAPVPPGLNPFVGLMRRVAADVQAARYDHEQLKGWIVGLGDATVTSLPQLNGRPELIATLNALLDAV